MIFAGSTLSLRVAVDIDGVLADQVTLILAKLNIKYGLRLTKNDIIQWDQKIKDTNIKYEIETALLDKNFVLSLPIIPGSERGMGFLYNNHYVIVATARPTETEEATRTWVSNHFKFHDFCNTKGKQKDCVLSNILIDDYIPNIKHFALRKGIGLLFSQPWNQERDELEKLIEENKVFCCNNWEDVISAIKEIA